MTYDVRNTGLALGQAPGCGGVKLVNEIRTFVLYWKNTGALIFWTSLVFMLQILSHWF
jgi:hypothetical protein